MENNKENKDNGMRPMWLTDRVCVHNGVLAVVNGMKSSSALFDEPNLSMMNMGGYRLAPWGVDNDLPQQVMAKIDLAEIVGTNANFNWKVAYGLGPKLMRVIRDPQTNRAKDFYEMTDGEAYEWFMANNVPLLLMEIMTDLSYFGNAFPLLTAGQRESKVGKRTKISGIVHREAMFSRWGVDDKNLINKHLYSAKWDKNPSKDDIQASYVIDEFNAVNDINRQLTAAKEQRMCFPIYLPSPGRPFYSYPNWWSIFRSGWYDQLVSIPNLKKAILKNNLGVRYILHISDEYYKQKEARLGIQENDHEARRKLYEETVKQIEDVLAGEENAGKAIVSRKVSMPNGNGMATEKLIEIELVKNEISGGEYLTDYETGANIISYAMDVHPSLIGATPGKNSNSLSGSNYREIFLGKQSLSKPLTQLALQWWPVVREVNGWDRDLEIVMQDSLFTTLDNAKSGEVKTADNVTQ